MVRPEGPLVHLPVILSFVLIRNTETFRCSRFSARLMALRSAFPGEDEDDAEVRGQIGVRLLTSNPLLERGGEEGREGWLGVRNGS
jgi:hypothetical protein